VDHLAFFKPPLIGLSVLNLGCEVGISHVIKPAAIVIDPESLRRNRIARLLYDAGWHVEPFDCTDELTVFWPSASMLMTHDDDATLLRTFDLMLDRGRWSPIIVYADDPEPARIVDVILTGAMDYLKWPFSRALLQDRLRTLAERENSYSEVRQRVSRSRRMVASLTPREREVLFSLTRGASNKTIARQLQISPRTIEIHRANMMGKLGVKHVGEAISMALYSELSNSQSEDEAYDLRLPSS
jgi:FixJ family two-component response regulator